MKQKIKDLLWLTMVNIMYCLCLVIAHAEMLQAYNYDLTFEQNNLGMSLYEWFIQDMKKQRVCK